MKHGPNQTWRAKRAKTMRQKMVRVITSASCFTECSNALMMVFRPVTNAKNYTKNVQVKLNKYYGKRI